MRLPNAYQAVVEVRKLTEYCLNTEHPRGRHKARVFASALGITASNAEWLREALLESAHEHDASPGERDSYGQRYFIDFKMETSAGMAWVRSCWIVRDGEDFPRLTSCYVL
jgi:hypothetical protein